MKPKAEERIPAIWILRALMRRGMLTALVLLLFCGCAGSPERTYVIKEPKIFRRTWFDFYNRARWRLQEGKFQEAEQDFRQALARHDIDSWEERSYGVHFIEYFPHRELGVTLYNLKRYEEAKKEFERSLELTQSSRAKFYLNRVRRTLIESSGEDRQSPRVFIDEALEGMTTGEFSVSIQGRAEDDTFVSAIRVAGEPVFFELWSPQIEFEKVIPLHSGQNEIEIVVEDITGKETRRELEIRVDRQAPLLLVHEIQVLERQVQVKATLEDAGGLKAAKIGDFEIALEGQIRYDLDRRFPYEGEPGEIPFVVEDQVGNDLRGEIKVEQDKRTAWLDSPDYLQRPGNGYPQEWFQPGVLVAANPFIAQGENQPPAITLRGIDSATNTVFLDRYYIEGRVRSEEQVGSLQINGKELLMSRAKEVHFGEVVSLKSATNEFIVTAKDRQNRASEQRLNIFRIIPESLSIGTRLAVTLSPFEYLGEEEEGTKQVDDKLVQAFVDARRFQVLDRESLESIMLERKLGASALADPSTAARLGRLQNADMILSGYVRPYPRSNGIEVVGRLIDTESSEILFEHDVYGEQQDEFTMTKMLEGLYVKFARGFPLLQGSIVTAGKKMLEVDLGYGGFARKQMRFMIYREGKKLINPINGRVLGAKTEMLGKGTIDKVLDQSATLEVIEKKSGISILTGDKVIAR